MTNWEGSTHFQKGMDCSSCHDPHSASLKIMVNLKDPTHTASENQKLPIEEKESYRWIEAFKQTIALTPEGVQVVTVCDREADFYEMFVISIGLLLWLHYDLLF